MGVCAILLLEFQFHKGTIKTGFSDDNGNTYTNFNSIKVRLKLVEFFTLCTLFLIHFNSIKVRLKQTFSFLCDETVT